MVRSECSSISIVGVDPNLVERKHIVAQYIWTMAKSIKVQETYQDALFRNHPSIATVINYHLFQHRVPDSKFDKQMDKVADMKSINVWKGQITRDIKHLQLKK